MNMSIKKKTVVPGFALSKGERTFNIFNNVLMFLILLITLYPFYYTFIASLSDGREVISGNVILAPVSFNLNAYKQIPKIPNFFLSYGNTIFYTFFGTLISLCVMSMGAYALSRTRLKGRRVLSFIVSFTLWFKAGIMPIYLNMDSLNLLNSRLGILFGFAINAFYIVIMRTYFEGLPVELEEAARLDGLSNFGIFFKIMAPLSKPMFATITMYCAIDRWNGYFWSMILLQDADKVPLQVLLKKIIIENQVMAAMDASSGANYSRETLVYAIIICAIIPIICAYPFFQRYFIKGLTVGAVKG